MEREKNRREKEQTEVLLESRTAAKEEIRQGKKKQRARKSNKKMLRREGDRGGERNSCSYRSQGDPVTKSSAGRGKEDSLEKLFPLGRKRVMARGGRGKNPYPPWVRMHQLPNPGAINARRQDKRKSSRCTARIALSKCAPRGGGGKGKRGEKGRSPFRS